MFILVFFPILIIFLIIGYLVYMGAFLPIEIEEKTVGPFHFIYKEINGKDYSLIGKTTKEISETLQKYNFSKQKPMQIFFPDDYSNLAQVGLIVKEKIGDLPNVQSKTLEATLSMTTTFPWRNSYSFIFGFMKIDPALQNFRKSKNYKKTEVIVLLNEDTIHYIQPIK